MDTFTPTHLVRGIPAVKIIPETGYPYFVDENGKRMGLGPGNKAVALEPVVPSAPVAVLEPEPELKAEDPLTLKTVSLSTEAARAILQAAAWPSYESAYGYAESVNGDNATLDGITEDGSARVKVCLRGGIWHVVKVPRYITFEIAE